MQSKSLEPNPARRAAVEVSCIPRKFGVPPRPVSGVTLPGKAVRSGCLTTLRPNSCRHILQCSCRHPRYYGITYIKYKVRE
eukprot:scaffold44108_cov69-Phaeocystis_antarctica.AAC.2